MSARLATTILLLREAPTGIEVFMVRRNRRVGFLPDAWVFPGGRVDGADHLDGHPALRGGEASLALLGLPRAQGLPLLVAGVRETFEEAGIWLGDGRLPDGARGPLARGETRLAELLDAYGATVDLDRLRPWSWWITPEAEPRRYDTRFFVARADGEVGRHDDGETVESGWFDPREVLRDATIDRFPLAPPTWWTLRELAGCATVAHALAQRDRPCPPIQPVLRFDEHGPELLLPGHPEHPHPAVEGLATRLTFEERRWVAWSGEDRLPALP